MKWIGPVPVLLSGKIPEIYRHSLILGKELIKKGVTNQEVCEQYLNSLVYKQTSPFVFKDMEKVVERILQAVSNNETIGIWGDFDVDGQTSTAILILGLSGIYAKTIFHLPIRASESHGMQLEAFTHFLKANPALIITCDTGISGHTAIDFANSRGVDVIITDHHTPPSTLPDAYAVLNPHQLPEKHPMSYLAGVGVAFQVIRAVAQRVEEASNPDSLHDLVALGTIADLAELRGENRFYAQSGLLRMNKDLRAAFSSILALSNRRNGAITENTIGFNIAPRLNSAGRLGDANENVHFLISEDEDYCDKFALNLENFNDSRKSLVDSVYRSAKEMLEKEHLLSQRGIIILHNEGWHPGVLGIVAGKLAEEFSIPALLLNDDNGIASGSARSIEGIDVISAIQENDADLIRYGGHAMAAGLSIPINKLPDFINGLRTTTRSHLRTLKEERELSIDHFISFSDIGNPLFEELKILSPFGSGNQAPIFACENIEISNQSQFGSLKNHTQLTLQDVQGNTQNMIRWNSSISAYPFEKIDIAFQIEPDDFQRGNSYFLEYVDLREHQPLPVNMHINKYPIEFEDCRNVSDQLNEIEKILKNDTNAQIWGEGLKKPETFLIRNRWELDEKEHLVIMNAPPGFSVLNHLIEQANPRKILLFSWKMQTDDAQQFLMELGSILKQSFQKQIDEINIRNVAATLCQREETIFDGLVWFQEHGDIMIAKLHDGKAQLTQAHASPTKKINSMSKKLRHSLQETAAFRKYYLRVDSGQLMRKLQL